MARKLTAQEKRWQAESDVRLLRDYALLQGDEARFGAATKTLAEEQAKISAVVGAQTMNAFLREALTKNKNQKE